jgi:CubicO group peptidase (beta-lactamase class C family)
MRARRTLILTALAIAALAAAAGWWTLKDRKTTGGTELVADDPTARAIDTYLTRAVPFGYSGSALVARGSKILVRKGYGLADDRARTPNTAVTVHSIGSVTKQFTAAAIMKLWMLGKLTPEDELGRYFPDAPPDKKTITLHHLLTHTAGITNYTGDDYAAATREQMKQAAFAAPLDFLPGTEYRYSNAGYSLLAAVVELASGREYERFLHDELLAPAGLERTGYRIPDWSETTLARAYVGTNDNGTNLEKIFPSWNLLGNGELLSTVDDMYRWHVALSGDHILSPAAKKKLYTPNLNNYAYGWNIKDTAQGKLITHNGGSDQGTGCEYLRFPDSDTVIIIFANRDSTATFFRAGIGDKVKTLLFGGEITMPPEGSTDTPTTAAGKYHLADGSAFELSAEPELRITAIGRTAGELLAYAPADPPEDLPGLGERAERAIGAAIDGDPSLLERELDDGARLARWKRYLGEIAADVAPPRKTRVAGVWPSAREIGDRVAGISVENENKRRWMMLYFKAGRFAGLGGGDQHTGVSMRLLSRGANRFVGHELASGATVELELRASGEELMLGGKVIARRNTHGR